MTRTSVAFADAFAFARAATAPVVDATGATIVAGVDVARFDHDPATHVVLGLKVEGAAQNGAPDLVPVKDASWVTAGRKLVLQTYLTPAGALARAAHFTDDPQATIDGVMRGRATHQWHAVFPAAWLTDVDDVGADPALLTRDGDAITWLGRPGQVWTVASSLVLSAPGEHTLSAPGERIIDGAAS